MVFGRSDGDRIVRSWPGTGTLDTYYETADGTVWRNNPILSTASATAPMASGTIVDGRIIRNGWSR